MTLLQRAVQRVLHVKLGAAGSGVIRSGVLDALSRLDTGMSRALKSLSRRYGPTFARAVEKDPSIAGNIGRIDSQTARSVKEHMLSRYNRVLSRYRKAHPPKARLSGPAPDDLNAKSYLMTYTEPSRFSSAEVYPRESIRSGLLDEVVRTIPDFRSVRELSRQRDAVSGDIINALKGVGVNLQRGG